jgi:hypothetical protein
LSFGVDFSPDPWPECPPLSPVLRKLKVKKNLNMKIGLLIKKSWLKVFFDEQN